MAVPLNILHIEDSHRDFALVELHLEQAGLAARCHQAATREQIAAALEKQAWDLFLVDYRIPGVVWRDTVTAIREKFPDTPVILVSGTVGEERAVDLLKDGAWDFILKGNLLRLVPAIERCLREAQARRAQAAAEAALRLSEERFRLAQQGTGDGLWDWEPWTHTLYLSPSWKAMLGYADNELENSYETWVGLLPPEDPTPWILQLSKLMADKRTQFEFQYRLRHKAGHYLDIQARCWVVRNGQGLPERVVGTHEDVTHRLEKVKTLTTLLNVIADAVLVVSEEGKIMMASEQCEQVFHYRPEELVGQPVELLIPEHYRQAHVAHRTGFSAKPHPRPMASGLELWGRRREGTEIPVDIALSPITLPHSQERAVCAVVHDVSHHREMLNRLQRDNADLEAAKARLEMEVLRLKAEQAKGPAK